MAASAAPLPSTRWSRTLAHTLLACAASLALHAVALGGLAWLYHRSTAMAPPAAEVRIAAVYLAPAAAREDGRSEAAAPAAPVVQETRETTAPPVSAPPAARAEAPPPRVVETPPRQPVEAAVAEIPARLPPSLPPEAGAGAEPATSVAARTPDAARPALAVPLPAAGKGRDAGSRPSDARTHAGIEWRVQDWLAQHRHYPRAARRSGAEGTVWVRFVLDRGGDLQGSEILESSGHAVLDRAALELLEKASPFPALPPELTTDEIELVLPIEYDLTRTGRG